MTKELVIANIPVQVTYKRIKNLYLKVKANRQVLVSAPLHLSEEQLVTFLNQKIPWIQNKLAKLEEFKMEKPVKYCSGEIHYLWGKAYLLEVIQNNGVSRVELQVNKTIKMFVKNDSTIEQRQKLMNEWYRAQLKEKLPGLVSKWEQIIGVRSSFIGVRNMRTRWGSCNVTKKRVWLNLQLAKKPIRCLEYVIVHELVHLLEKNHNRRFYGFMDRFLPEWPELKQELNRGF
ncbi:MAG: M48 family metallopeptidase [Firmicutes bacterium]|mgnify:CR=1 FL=1|nr:M48 family metallopeptidase [Bacillota bacterium]